MEHDKLQRMNSLIRKLAHVGVLMAAVILLSFASNVCTFGEDYSCIELFAGRAWAGTRDNLVREA
ncbi:hypothetical protein AK812_SmicGene47631, partial [Symbiodinium microadriaticum]